MITALQSAMAVNSAEVRRSCLCLENSPAKEQRGLTPCRCQIQIERQLIPPGSFVNPSQDFYILIHANTIR